MNCLKIFSLSIYNENINFFKELGYIPVGLGSQVFDCGWMKDNSLNNISKKNRYYGEYSFHYWLWKNYLPHFKSNEWIGFSTYRRFWTLKDCENENFTTFKKNIIINLPKSWDNSEIILPKKLEIGKIKKSKIIKNFGFRNTFAHIDFLFKKKHNLYEHFIIFHGKYHLEKAIKLLPKSEKNDFEEYISNYSFNPHNLFICRNVKILEEFYKNVFSWLFKCEGAFDMKKLHGYEIRMLGFLAEHFVSFWFQKYFSVFENDITFFDTHKKKVL